MMQPQLSSPLLQGTAGTPTSSSVLGISSNQQGINLLATQLQSPVALQSASTTLPRQNMPTLTPLSSVSNALTSSSTDNTNTSTNNSNTLPLLNMPVLGKLQWYAVYWCGVMIHDTLTFYFWVPILITWTEFCLYMVHPSLYSNMHVATYFDSQTCIFKQVIIWFNPWL